MIGGVAPFVARITTGKQPFEVVKSEPQFVGRHAGKGLGKKLVHSIAHRCRITDLNGVGYIEIVAAILRHDSPVFFLPSYTAGKTLAGRFSGICHIPVW